MQSTPGHAVVHGRFYDNYGPISFVKKHNLYLFVNLRNHDILVLYYSVSDVITTVTIVTSVSKTVVF